jgi:hypothetical protein
MSASPESFAVYLESGQKRAVAGVLDWPGWCRVGRDEDAALRALADHQPRYARILRGTEYAAALAVPALTFTIAERLAGNATTNFGVPGQPPAWDLTPLDAASARRYRIVLGAIWRGFDAAAAVATGAELRRGPRGGGRDLDGIVWHTLGAERGYLAGRGWKIGAVPEDDPVGAAALIHQGVLDALAAAARGEVPERGPRGGVRWPPRYFVRRVAWHVLDHLWEIEDRIIG